MNAHPTVVSTDPKSIAIRSIHNMARGNRTDFDEVIGVGGFTRESRAAPPSARGTGPDAFYELALWLRAAFEDLTYEIYHAVTERNLITVNSTMHGRHTAPIAFYTEDGKLDTVFPPTGRTFAITQSHWFRIEDGKIVEHWANRDDLGLAKQLGWVPPTPTYLIRMARAKRRAQRSLYRVAAESAVSRHVPAEPTVKHRRIEGEALFPLSPEQTWDLVFGNRLQRLVELSDSIVAVENYEMRANGTPRYVMVTRIGPVTIRSTSDYTVYNRPRNTVNAVLDSPFGGVYEMDFQPDGANTRVSYCWSIETTTPFARILLPVLAPLIARSLRADLETVASRVSGTRL